MASWTRRRTTLVVIPQFIRYIFQSFILDMSTISLSVQVQVLLQWPGRLDPNNIVSCPVFICFDNYIVRG